MKIVYNWEMIKVRSAQKEDIADLQTLNNEVFVDNVQYDEDLDLNWARSDKGKQYFNELLNNADAFCIIAEDNDKRVGYLAASPKEIDYRHSRYIEIQNMGVIPEYRSQGVGKLLMDDFFKWARIKGYEKVFINAYIKNHRAISFYKNAGFDEIDISLEKKL